MNVLGYLPPFLWRLCLILQPRRLEGNTSLYPANFICKDFLSISHGWNKHTEQRAQQHADSRFSLHARPTTVILRLYTLLFFFFFPLCFYLLDLSTRRSSCVDARTSRANLFPPGGCCPRCHLSSPPCRLSMSDKLPGLARCYS